MLTSASALVDAVRRHRLLDPPQLAELSGDLFTRFPDPRGLAQELIRRAWLTPYQINQLLQGRGQELVLGSYVLLERLGEGGMGLVFKARHVKLGRIVALKLVRKERLANVEAVRRFHREIQAAAKLNHPNIVLAFDADEAAGSHFFAMEFVEGSDLARLVKEGGPLPVANACAYIHQAALGLQHAHERGMVHRDIKPSNLMLTKHGSVKLLDMGLARLSNADGEGVGGLTLTQENSVMGTPDYVAPEQTRNAHTADIRADLYSLGCSFYYLLTGRVPFPGSSLGEKLVKHQLDEAPPVESLRPDVPAPVAAVVRKLMAKRPEERYQTPAELAAALAKGGAVRGGAIQVGALLPRSKSSQSDPVEADETIAAGTTPLEADFRRRWGSKWRLVPLFGASGILLFGLVALLLAPSWQSDDSRKSKPITPMMPVNIINDPGFEMPNVGTGAFESSAYNPNGSPWTFTKGAGVAGNSSGFTSANPKAPQGTQVAFLQGAPAKISQSLNFAAGRYTLNFQAAQRGIQNQGPQTFQVRIDATLVGTFTPTSTTYVTMSTDGFTVAAGPHTIAFEGLNPLGGDNTVFIDLVTLSAAAVQSTQAEDRITNSMGMKLKLIPAGNFLMGSPPNEPGRATDEDQHGVEITKPFCIGIYQVTVAQFRTFVQAKGYKTEAEKAGDKLTWQQPGFTLADDQPVVLVTWNDAMAFCDWLSEKEGKRYLLPTEAQWEYSCRAGTKTVHYCGDDGSKLTEYAWFAENAGGQLHPAGQLKPNPWGLHDMYGNAWNWVADWYAPDYYKKSPKADPPGPAAGTARVIRGGSFYDKAVACRSACRNGENAPSTRFANVGFRVVLLLPLGRDRP